jgi:hypothetical protein
MALPILDGNQSPTTLSTIIVSNAHIPAHTVTSLGTQAITDIATAVSGVELGPKTLNALENITVTLGQVTITGGLTDAQLRASPVTIAGTVTANVAGNLNNTIEFYDEVTAEYVVGVHIKDAGNNILGGGVPLNISGTVTANLAPQAKGPIVEQDSAIPSDPRYMAVVGGMYGAIEYRVIALDSGGQVAVGSLPSISGTVTANLGSSIPSGTNRIGVVTIGSGTVTLGASTAQIGSVTASISGTPSVTFGTAVITGSTSIIGTPSVTFTQIATHGVTIGAGTAQIGSVTASISGTPSITFGTAVITGSTSILNFPATQTVTFTQAPVTFGTAVITGSTSILNFPATQTVTFTQITTHGVTIANTSVTVNGTFYQATQPVSLATLPALVASTAQIGSVTASISGTPSITFSQASVTFGTAVVTGSASILNFPATQAISIASVTIGAVSTTVTVSNVQGSSATTTTFTSLTSSTSVVSASSTRKALTIFNEGFGNLHISPTSTCTTQSYQVRLLSGDYWECPPAQVTLAHVGVYATTGTAYITNIS